MKTNLYSYVFILNVTEKLLFCGERSSTPCYQLLSARERWQRGNLCTQVSLFLKFFLWFSCAKGFGYAHQVRDASILQVPEDTCKYAHQDVHGMTWFSFSTLRRRPWPGQLWWQSEWESRPSPPSRCILLVRLSGWGWVTSLGLVMVPLALFACCYFVSSRGFPCWWSLVCKEQLLGLFRCWSSWVTQPPKQCI